MINNTVEVDPLWCGHCKTINLLEIISKNNDYIIQSHCGSCNSKTKEIPMYSFIHSSSQLSSDSYKCSLHPDKGYKYYCKSCRMNYCELSLSKHSKHDIVKLDDLMNEEKYKKYYELLRQANIIVKKISNEIKTSLVNSLTEQALLLNNYIKNIEESYSNYSRVNNRLLGILQVLYEMYNKSKEHTCYQLIRNMLSNSNYNFQIPLINQQNSSSEFLIGKASHLIKYFTSSTIIDISQTKKKKELSLIGSIYLDKISNFIYITSDNKIASFSQSTHLLSIYNPFTLSLEKNISGIDPFTSIILPIDNARIASIYQLGKDIKLWKISEDGTKYDKIAIYAGHQQNINKIIKLQFPINTIASCSVDRTIKIWSTDPPYDCLYTYEGHTNIIYSIVETISGLLVSGSIDKTIRFWKKDPFTKDPVKIIENVSCNQNRMIEVAQRQKLIVVGKNHFTVINVNSMQVESLVECSRTDLIQMLYDSNTFITSGMNSLSLWDGDSYKQISKIERAHDSFINDLIKMEDFDYYMTLSTDRTIKIWKYI